MTILPENIEDISDLSLTDKVDKIYEYIQYMTEQITWFTSAKKLGETNKSIEALRESDDTITDNIESIATRLGVAEDHITDNGQAISVLREVVRLLNDTKTAPANLNDISANGVYSVAASTTNAPVTQTGILMHFVKSSNAAVQFFTRETTTNYVLYMRKSQGGSWGAWKSITFA